MLINEELELNNINTNLTISEDDTDYCCICINTIQDDFIKLRCCKQYIHEKCITEFITSINNNVYNCPICRKQLNTPVSFGRIIDYMTEKPELISTNKIQDIIKKLYKDIPIKHLFNIDGNEEIQHLKNTIEILTLKIDKYRMIFLFISLPLIIMFTVFVFNNYSK
jgi:hypothetical protein|uniref:RING-type domain-containing protein n=1 Tax=viral metagenome TaxID=1070528 RepID=A0A6C0AN92_9ZZZZ